MWRFNLRAGAVVGLGVLTALPSLNASEAKALPCARLGGFVGAKADALIAARLVGTKAEGEIFEETERAFATCYDDQHPTNVPPRGKKGFWQGEYWGKTVLSMLGAARYTRDARLVEFLRAKAHRLVRDYQRPDGYLATYANADFVVGWNWNVWSRKYTLWALVELYRATGDREILSAAERLANHLLAQLKRLNVSIAETGCFVGMPSMSILKPMLLLYRETHAARYLDFAREIVRLNDRADGTAPNLIANAFGDRPVHAWYPKPQGWAKAYELMSVLEGFVEYAQVTGEKRPLEAVERVWEKLVADELNVLDGVGLHDHFVQAAADPNAGTEICDVIHWMRLNRFLYEATGRPRYLDFWERAFLNAFLAGIYRGGAWCAFSVRSHGFRHHTTHDEVGMCHHFCCLDNAPRAFWDYADCQVRTAGDAVEVNFYTDAHRVEPGLEVWISGGYPLSGDVTLTIVTDRSRTVSLRVPDWARQTMTVDGRRADEARRLDVPAGTTVCRLRFDLTPRTEAVVLRPPVGDLAKHRSETFELWWLDGEMKGFARTMPGSVTRQGPLLMASRKGSARRVPFAFVADEEPVGSFFSVFDGSACGEEAFAGVDDATIDASPWSLRPGCGYETLDHDRRPGEEGDISPRTVRADCGEKGWDGLNAARRIPVVMAEGRERMFSRRHAAN